jgi:hypothetical protein
MIEAKYPASLFQQQINALVESSFSIMRSNIKKEITPILVSSTAQAVCWKHSMLAASNGSFQAQLLQPASNSNLQVRLSHCQWGNAYL